LRLSAVKIAPLSVSIEAGRPSADTPQLEGLDDVGGLGRDERAGRDQQPRVVIDHVQDLDVAAIGEGPVGGVGLPALVGQLGLEPPPRALRSLVGLRG
jgi:hypothetical protein